MFLTVLSFLGVGVFAASGALAAGRKGFDLLGVLVIAAVTAIGGGTLRDLLLDRHPIFWIADVSQLWAVLIGAASVLIYTRLADPPDMSLSIADAMGLALFTISGAQIAEQRGVRWVIIIIMGTITGAAGGVLRDVLSGEVPLILRRGELYATAAIAGAVIYLLLEASGIGSVASAILGMIAVAAVRFAAIAWKLRLPVVRVPPQPTEVEHS
jgi:uncharacterized membrane protein YeiH